jgi:two-component system sensor kinase FixL
VLAQLESRPYIVIALGYIASYVALDWLSYVEPFSPAGITPWSPSTGLSVAIILLLGYRFIPCLVLSVGAADSLVRGLPLPTGVEILTGVVIAGGYGGMCAALLGPLRFDPKLESKRDLFLLLAAAVVASAVVASCYVALIIAAGMIDSAQFGPAMLRYWVGDMIGITILTPFLLVLMTRPRLPSPAWEMLLPLALLGTALWLVFGFVGAYRFQLFYLLFLPVVWTAVRFGLEGVTWALLISQVSLIILIQLSGQSTWNLTAYQALMVVLSVTGLAVGALVSEQYRTERQLRMHQEAIARVSRLSSMGEFAAALAHEINQPLTAIGNYVRLVKSASMLEPPDNARVAEAAGKAAEQVHRAAEVVRRLREFIRLGRSGTGPNPLPQLMEDAATLCRPEYDRHGVKLGVQFDRDLPNVLCDSLQVQQVIVNLLRNSLESITDAGRRDGRVTIEAEREGDKQVLLRVRDNGPGFDRSLLGKQITPFTTTKPEGMGLGLSLSRSIIESHGGRLTIGGDANGAEISFTLPTAARKYEVAR